MTAKNISIMIENCLELQVQEAFKKIAILGGNSAWSDDGEVCCACSCLHEKLYRENIKILADIYFKISEYPKKRFKATVACCCGAEQFIFKKE